MRNKMIRLLGLALAGIFLPGCASRLQHETNYAEKKTVMLYPVVNRINKDSTRISYFDERRMFSLLVDFLSDKGFLVICASDKQAGRPTAKDLEQLDNSLIPDIVPHSPCDLSMIVSLDAFRATDLAIFREYALTCYVFDNRAAKLVWKKTTNHSAFRGLIGGPMEVLMSPEAQLKHDDFQSRGYSSSDLQDAATASIMECPLFNPKKP
jgi:hypothetical protein